MKRKEELYSFPRQNDGAVVETDIRIFSLVELQVFEGHPFKVENDKALFELMLSIEKEGVIVPTLARPKPDGGYELIAYHRRKAAYKWAVMVMVDCNLQQNGFNFDTSCDRSFGPSWTEVR